MENRKKIITTINHTRLEIEGEKAFMTLAQFLRTELNLTGTKVVCAEGDCGACTILLGNKLGPDGKLLFKSVNACILPLYLIDGAQVITVEGLKVDNELSLVQKSMADNHGTQCGFCTPGFICAMSGMNEKLKNEKLPITEKRVKNFLSGNLCRCTGYRPIIEAGMKINLSEVEFLKDRFGANTWLLEIKQIQNKSVLLDFNDREIFLPITLNEALEAKKNDSSLSIIAGGTDLNVVVNKGKMEIDKAMALYRIEELKIISHDKDFLHIGAAVTLTELENYIEKFIPEFSNLLHIFASPQIKNQATLVGNVVNASPIGDTIPFLMVSEAEVCIQRVGKRREVKISKFYLGYKKLDLKSDELVVGIKVPMLKKEEHLKLYKMSLRKDLDISAVTFAGIVSFDQNKKMTKVHLALGGVGPTVVRLQEIEQKMLGEEFSLETFTKFSKSLPEYITPLSDLRASKEYRMLVSQNFFKKFYHEVASL